MWSSRSEDRAKLFNPVLQPN